MNSLAAHLNLLEGCNCQFIISATGVEVSDILTARPMKHVICPELEELLKVDEEEKYPFPMDFDQAVRDPYLILHTSGTTGLPKPFRITHGYIAANDLLFELPEECECGGPGFRRIQIPRLTAGRLISPLPPFHVIGQAWMLIVTVFGKSTYIFGPDSRSMSAMDMLDAIDYAAADKAFCAPSVLEKYSSSEQDLARLRKLSCIMYGGGMFTSHQKENAADLSHHIGALHPRVIEILSRHTSLTQFICSRPLTNSANREYITACSRTAPLIRERAKPLLYLPYNIAYSRMALAVREPPDIVGECTEALSQTGQL